MNPTISTLNEIPESLYELVQTFLLSNPHWDYDRLMSTSIALFLATQMEKSNALV